MIYGIDQPTDEAASLARILAAQGRAAVGAAQARRPQGPRARTSSGSTTSSTRPTPCHGRRRAAVPRRSDPLEVIKWRDLYRELENAIDAAEDAAEAIERMFHKAT